MTKVQFEKKLNFLLDFDSRLVLWGIREGSDGWGGREWHAVIEDTISDTIMKVRYESCNDGNDNEPDIYFMAHKIGWSPIGYRLKECRAEAEKTRQENRKIAEQNAAMGVYDD